MQLNSVCVSSSMPGTQPMSFKLHVNNLYHKLSFIHLESASSSQENPNDIIRVFFVRLAKATEDMIQLFYRLNE